MHTNQACGKTSERPAGRKTTGVNKKEQQFIVNLSKIQTVEHKAKQLLRICKYSMIRMYTKEGGTSMKTELAGVPPKVSCAV